MKRVTSAALAAALLATIAFAEATLPTEPAKRIEPQRAYLPSGSDATGSFTVAFTLPPS